MIEILLKTSFFSSLLSHLIGKHKGKSEGKTTLKILFKYFDKISKWPFNLLDLTLNSHNFQFCHFNPLIMTNTYILYACMSLCMNACMNSYAFRIGYYTRCLFQAIKCLFEFKNMIKGIKTSKPGRLFNIYLLIYETI